VSLVEYWKVYLRRPSDGNKTTTIVIRNRLSVDPSQNPLTNRDILKVAEERLPGYSAMSLHRVRHDQR